MTVKPETVEQIATPVQKKELPSAPDSSKAPDGSLSQAELAGRLKNLKTGENMHTSNVGRERKKGEQEFFIWSKQRDPDSIGWRYCEETARYFPQDEP